MHDSDGNKHHCEGNMDHGDGSMHHGKGSMPHGDGRMHHDVRNMHHGDGSTHHGDGSMLHGERSMHHGDGSMLHIERSMHHGDGSYSAAEYACPMWARSTQANKLNPALHDCYRIISGCLKPTNLDSIHLLAGITPPHIKRTVACRMERTRQTTDARHQLFHHKPAASRL